MKFEKGKPIPIPKQRFQGYVKRPIQIRAVQIFEEFEVETLEGTMKGKPGDFLIVGIRGEMYPIDKDIFLESYQNIKDWKG